ncbi:hypothetical protein Rhow_005047 [Rhodococcus wratislaviensis]|uniref:Uncharacterized protein n=1 Tax=Rhodococcus wratislaviensis TaxID=44752 RepID=A0A402CCR4_RHOWR|nr:hypothetical protein Rhow_005047 [Rhodococcus wratislaviensis]
MSTANRVMSAIGPASMTTIVIRHVTAHVDIVRAPYLRC